MSEADYLEDGAEYIMDDCDGECDSCPCVNCDEHPKYKRKLRVKMLQENIRRLEFE